MPAIGMALTFPLPADGEDLVGNIKVVASRYEDTLSDIARLHDIGFLEITTANPDVDPWIPGEGTRVIIPTRFILPPGPREGIVINLAELRLYYYPPGKSEVITYPIGIGREGWSTPTGQSHVNRKAKHPTWYPPESIRAEYAERGEPLAKVVPPGPDNPLGDYAIYLTMRGYLIHGTDKPYGVGMRVSHGCIRLYPEDIERLFPQIAIDTPVRIINQPYKAGWQEQTLYIEAHPPLQEQVQSEGNNLTPIVASILRTLGQTAIKPDWKLIREVAIDHLGIPVQVTP